MLVNETKNAHLGASSLVGIQDNSRREAEALELAIDNPELQEESEQDSRITKLLGDFDRLKAKPEAKSLKDKILQYSTVVFSRESTYRGFVDIFAEDIPSLLAAAMRNKKYFYETVFKLALSTTMMFAAPLLTRAVAFFHGKKVFSDDEQSKISKYLLFSNDDLKDTESFDKARHKLAEHDIKDKLNQAKVFGAKSNYSKNLKEKAHEIYEFSKNYKATDDLRRKIIDFKTGVIKRESLIEGFYWGFRPLFERLFRKYVLGVNRFTGSLKYLSNKDADKLGNKKTFTPMQILGTVLASITTPGFAAWVVHKTKDLEKIKDSGVLTTLRKHFDFSHSYYPKFWLYASFSNLPLMFSKLFNAQDPFEMAELMIRSLVTGSSLFMGERATNGRYARTEDHKLAEKYNVEPGILYHPVEKKSGFWAKLQEIFPLPSKFAHVLERTEHNEELKKEATSKFKSTFYKGFFIHAIGTFLLKIGIYKLTKLRILSALRSKK